MSFSCVVLSPDPGADAAHATHFLFFILLQKIFLFFVHFVFIFCSVRQNTFDHFFCRFFVVVVGSRCGGGGGGWVVHFRGVF